MQVSLRKRYAAAQDSMSRLVQAERDRADRIARAHRRITGRAIDYTRRPRVSLHKAYVTDLVLARQEGHREARDNFDLLLRLARLQRAVVVIDYTPGGGGGGVMVASGGVMAER